jgi:hypothetical protein
MKKKLVIGIGFALSMGMGQAMAQDAAPTCADLNWAADVLAANPDIAQSCKGVYEKNGEMYAKVSIEVVRVRGNRMTFRPMHTDGSKGNSRSIVLDNSFRAEIGGREYRASDLMRGQELNVYMPPDRFALAVDEELDMVVTEEVVEMPTTASPLFLIGLLGGAFVALGGMLSGIRRRLA